jgi:hypothetical protein
LAGPLSAYQLGAQMAPVLGPGAEECLVVPTGSTGAEKRKVTSPESQLFGGTSVEEVAQGFSDIIGEGEQLRT